MTPVIYKSSNQLFVSGEWRVVTVHISSHPNLDGEGNSGVLTLTRRPNAGRRRRIGNNANMGRQTKLFGGSLEEYLEETNQVILASDIHFFVQ